LVQPNCAIAALRNSVRRWWLSTSVNRVSGHSSARTRAGTPPPEPRSAALAGAVSAASAKPLAWSMWVSTGPGPRKPHDLASSSRSRRVPGTSVREDDDVAAGFFAIGGCGHAVDGIGRVVDHLAVSWV